MKVLLKYCISLLIVIMIGSAKSYAQYDGNSVKVKDGILSIRIDKRHPETYKHLILYFGLNEDSLFKYGNIRPLEKEGWYLQKRKKKYVEIAKTIYSDTTFSHNAIQPIFFQNMYGDESVPGYPTDVPFGVNNFIASPTVFENKKGETIFIVKNNSQAKNCYLSGNFNDWSTSVTPMLKTDSGWVAILQLKPGKYFYKYIIDGQWTYDIGNAQKEDDGYDSFNSTYYRYNYTFTLQGFADAKNVILAGDFDNWDDHALKMTKTNTGWQLPMYLSEGNHTYKFIVDKQWILDPDNTNVRSDGMGNFNSFIQLGTPVIFSLIGYTGARLVVLSGSFNNWNSAEIEMQRTDSGWQVPYILASGTYEYKFIEDGVWITDPANPFTSNTNNQTNSVLTVNANYTFTLHQFLEAKQVIVSGSFNDWNPNGYTMIKENGAWIFPIYLPTGKYIYKFIVDGNWILDPDNPTVEENEYNTGNSVLWMEPKTQNFEK